MRSLLTLRRLPALLVPFLALLLAPGGGAEVAPRARPILEHLVEATGGAAARQREQTVHVVGRIETIGLAGRWEQWTAPPDRWMRRMTLGSLRFREGFDGRVAWRTDLTDKHVTVRSAAEAADARDEGWFLNERWALPDPGGGSVRAGSPVYVGDQQYDRLEIAPPGGGPARQLMVNRRTGLLERVVITADRRHYEDRLSNYRLLGGRKRPTVHGPPRDPLGDRPIERMTIDSVHVNAPFDTTRFSPPVTKDRAIAWGRGTGSVRVPFDYVSKAVIVQVSIDGRPAEDFLLDTGASLSVLDTDYAYGLGYHAEGQASAQGIAASASMRFLQLGSIALATGGSPAATLRDFRVALLPWGEGSKVTMWRKMAGILGADFLSRFVVEIDYDARTLTLHDPKTFRYDGNGTAIPFELHGGIPIVEMTVDDDCTGKFMVDVGNSFQFMLHGSLVRPCRLIGKKRRREVDVRGGGVGGGFTAKMCRLDSVRIGPYSWTEPVAVLTLANRGGIGSEDVHGNIGNTVLERFKCTFDYANRRLWLEPGRRYRERERVSRFGAMLARFGDHVVAGNVLSGSAAHEAGLRWYDQIVAIDGKPIERWRREDIDRLLEEGEVGRVLKVTYLRFRDEPEITVELKLKDVL